MNEQDLKNFWKKKTVVSYFLSVLVFFIHSSSYGQYPDGGTLISTVNDKLGFFFQESITRFAVPLFFILAGIAFFRDYDNSKYFSKLKSRLHTLVIPYLVWNTLWMLFNILCSYTFISSFFVGREIFELTLPNILEGIFYYGCNLPFWFLLDLILFVIASPLINLVIRNKYVGFGVTFALAVLMIFGIGLPHIPFKFQDPIVYYLLGGILGKHYFPYVLKRSSRLTQILSGCFLVIVITLKNLFPDNDYFGKPFVKTLVFILCSFAVWFLFDAFIDKIKNRPWYSRSFFVFAMNVNVSAIFTKLILFILPRKEIFATLNFVLTVVLTLVCINVFCYVIERYIPWLWYILCGKKPKKKSVKA